MGSLSLSLSVKGGGVKPIMPQFIDAVTTTGSTTTVNAVVPSSAQLGDILVAIFYGAGGNAQVTTIPAGWNHDLITAYGAYPRAIMSYLCDTVVPASATFAINGAESWTQVTIMAIRHSTGLRTPKFGGLGNEQNNFTMPGQTIPNNNALLVAGSVNNNSVRVTFITNGMVHYFDGTRITFGGGNFLGGTTVAPVGNMSGLSFGSGFSFCMAT